VSQTIFFADIDTQFDFMKSKGSLYVSEAQKIIPKLKKLTEFARKNNIKIISSLDTHLNNDKEFKQFPVHCVADSSGQRKIKETLLKKRIKLRTKKYSSKYIKQILNTYKQIIVEKNTFDVFSNPNAKSLFKYADLVFVYGVATDYCVKACCLGLLKLHKQVYLVEDAAKAVDKNTADKTLRQLKKKGVKLISWQIY